MDSISNTKKKKTEGKSKKCELLTIRVPVVKAGSKKYTHVSWDELLKANGKTQDEEHLRRFYDEDTLFMAKQLSETKGKNGKKIRVNLDALQHFNRASGYDDDDDFIDDSDAVDDGNFSHKKGLFYAGKGDVKELEDVEEEEEESSEEEEVVEVKKGKKRKRKEKKQEKSSEKKESKEAAKESSSSSDSESEPVRLSGAPPTIRMGGAPPSKRIQKRDPTPPLLKTVETAVKKKPSVAPIKESSSSSDIVCLDDEPAPKKAKDSNASSDLQPEIILLKKTSVVKSAPAAKPSTKLIVNKPSTSTEASGSNGIHKSSNGIPSSSSAPILTKVGQGAEKSTSSSSVSSAKSNLEVATETLKTLIEKLGIKGIEYQQKKHKMIDDETLKELATFVDLLRLTQRPQENEKVMKSVGAAFGMDYQQIKAQAEKGSQLINQQTTEWKLTHADLPHMSMKEIEKLTINVKAWKNKKEFPDAMVKAWLKVVNEGKLDPDQARNKLYELIKPMPDIESPQSDAQLEIPKHERSRKARMFLNQWIYLSRKHVQTHMPKAINSSVKTTEIAKKQCSSVNAMKEQLKKQLMLHESKKAKSEQPPFVFQFTDPVLAAIAPYLEDLLEFALCSRTLGLVSTGIESLYKPVESHITLTQFYIEIVRRFQKLSFLAVEEPMKKRIAQHSESIHKVQVVQNAKYQLKWPNDEEPSMRGLTRELQDFDQSILSNVKSANRLSSGSAAPNTTKSATSSTPKPQSSATSSSLQQPAKPSTSSASSTNGTAKTAELDAVKRAQMNQIVQVNNQNTNPSKNGDSSSKNQKKNKGNTPTRTFGGSPFFKKYVKEEIESPNGGGEQPQQQRMTGKPPV